VMEVSRAVSRTLTVRSAIVLQHKKATKLLFNSFLIQLKVHEGFFTILKPITSGIR
jgi:hypothetical protein